MFNCAKVTIHESQFPESVRLDLLESLRARQLNHKFLYESFKQTQKWLALHRAYSPSRTDPACGLVYQDGFAAIAQRLRGARSHLIGLGCGGGQKDSTLLKVLRESGCRVDYTPSDVSVAMVLVARQEALGVIAEPQCFPLVCDLSTAGELAAMFATTGGDELPTTRVFTFFGMIPNFEPEVILPKLASLVQMGDHLLLSANLAPGTNYRAGIERILPLYDNALTRDWLLTFILDLGIEKADGELRFVVESAPSRAQLKRIAAYFYFNHNRRIDVEGQPFEFYAGESIRLFFSYRHTPALVRTLLGEYGLRVIEQWITPSEEEGVFLVGRL
jgi:L-histidine N-alpha-methyltransferase